MAFLHGLQVYKCAKIGTFWKQFPVNNCCGRLWHAKDGIEPKLAPNGLIALLQILSDCHFCQKWLKYDLDIVTCHAILDGTILNPFCMKLYANNYCGGM